MLLSKYVHYVNLVNIATLAGMSYWEINDQNRFPLLIFPMLLGLMMLPMNNSLRDKNKQIIKVATIITLLALLSLVYPSIQVYLHGRDIDMIRVSAMVVVTMISLVALLNCVKKTKNNLI